MDARRLRLGMTACVVVMSLVINGYGDDPPPAPVDPRESPLGHFLGRLFGGLGEAPANPSAKKPNGDEGANLPAISPANAPTPDAVDDRAIAGREQQRDLLLALRLLETNEIEGAITLLQGLLEAEEDSLVLSARGHWGSLHQTVQDVISGGDSSLLEAYVNRFGPVANDELAAARRSGRLDAYAQVARRFRHTPAGQTAARIVAGTLRDCGEPLEAAYWSALTDEPVDLSGEAAETIAPADSTPAESWLQPFGGPTHHGSFPSTDPVLIERWDHPTAVRTSVVEQISGIVRDLSDNQQALIPTSIPLAVDGRIIARSLRGLSVFDADSGALIWESAEGVSVERLLAGEDTHRPGGESSGRGIRAITPYNGTNPESHPLANLLFRDGVYGLISSDGESVFVLEEHASLSYRQPGYFWGQRGQDDPFGRDWSTNQLVAYDIGTGEIRWRVGGEPLSDILNAPMTGILFLGPPVIDGEDLFVIGERNGTVSLYVLNRLNGQLQWSHAISEVGAAIGEDLVRRWWPAQPAVGIGVVVCPTTTGWMVAIDRLQHRIRWTYRYIETRQKKVSSTRSRVASAGPLNSRWCPGAPVLTDRHVLFTPSELPDPLYGDQPRVVCLDLLTGERRWWEPKDENLYIAGVAEGQILLAGTSSVEAREVSSGKLLWKTRLDTKTLAPRGGDSSGSNLVGGPETPSGRGIIADGVLLLPLQSGRLVSIDVASGNVADSSLLRDGESPLGNLIVYQGRLVSLDPFELRCFERPQPIAAESTAEGEVQTGAVLLRAAELLFAEDKFVEARDTLTSIERLDLEDSQVLQLDRLLWDTLIRLLRDSEGRADEELAQLETLAKTEAQRFAIQQARAQRLTFVDDFRGAFEIYWKQAETPTSLLVEAPPFSIRIDRWLSGRLHELWMKVDASDREQIEQHFESVLKTAERASLDELQWWSEILSFHRAGMVLRQQLASLAMQNEDWTVAEITLLQLANRSLDEQIQNWAVEELIRLLIAQGRSEDAAACLDQFAGRSTAIESLHRSFRNQLPDVRISSRSAWSDGTWQLQRSPATFNRAMFQPVPAFVSGLPSVDELQLQIEPNLQRLSVAGLPHDSVWDVPLQARSESFYNQTTGVTSVGQLLLIVHRGVLHGLSLPDRELLWREEINVQSASGGHVRGPANVRQHELRRHSEFLWSDGLRQTRTPMGMLAVWRPEYIAYFGRQTITLADPLTGRTLWSRTGVPPRTMVYGTATTLLIVPPSPANAYALSTVDGSLVTIPRLDSLVRKSVALVDNGLVQIDEHTPFRLFGRAETTVSVRLVEMFSGEEGWKLDFPAQTRFAAVSDHEIVAVDPDGAVSLINCQRGESRLLGNVGEAVIEETQQIYAMLEPGRLYVSFNQPLPPGSRSRSYQAVPVHGTLTAFDVSGGLLWATSVTEQNLVVEELRHLPVLLLTSQRPEREGDVTSQKLYVELRDKQTGKLLLADSRYITGGNLREMEIDPLRQVIDLKTYNDRLRLEVVAD